MTLDACNNSSQVKNNWDTPQVPFWIHFFSGGVSGSISAIATCPLELVKTRFQSSHYFSDQAQLSFRRAPLKVIYRHVSSTLGAKEGFFALWKGIGATLVGVIPSRAIHFSSYQTSKNYLSQYFFDGHENLFVHIASAVSAGISTTTVTNPIWVIKTRIQLQSTPQIYKNSFDCVRKVVRNEGPLALYQGMTASYLGCIEGTIQWVLYENLKAFLRQGTGDEIKSGTFTSTFLAAAFSKMIACLVTYPHEVLRTRLRQGPVGGVPGTHKKPYKGLFNTICRIYREEGIAPFYGGMTAHLLRVVPNAAITFFCYELFIHTFSRRFGYSSRSTCNDDAQLETVQVIE